MKLRNQQIIGNEFSDEFRDAILTWKDKFEHDVRSSVEREKKLVIAAVQEQDMWAGRFVDMTDRLQQCANDDRLPLPKIERPRFLHRTSIKKHRRYSLRRLKLPDGVDLKRCSKVVRMLLDSAVADFRKSLAEWSADLCGVKQQVCDVYDRVDEKQARLQEFLEQLSAKRFSKGA